MYLYVSTQVFSETKDLGMFCGTENTDTERVPGNDVILSPRNVLSVEFCSDFSNNEFYYGFKAQYSAVGKITYFKLKHTKHKPY